MSPLRGFAMALAHDTGGLRRPAKSCRRFAAGTNDLRERNRRANPRRSRGLTAYVRDYAAKAALAWATMASNAAGSAIAISESDLRSSSILAFARPWMNSL